MKKMVAPLLAVLSGILFAFILHIFFIWQETAPLPIVRGVEPSQCALCGPANIYTGVDTIALLDVKDWTIRDMGMTLLCQIDTCSFMAFDDTFVPPENHQHKYATFGINGVLRVHPAESFYRFEAIRPLNGVGTEGYIRRISDNNLLDCVLDFTNAIGADPEYLSSILCLECSHKVYELTKNTDMVLLDCLTNEVYPIQAQKMSTNIRNYTISRLLQTQDQIAFIFIYSLPENL